MFNNFETSEYIINTVISERSLITGFEIMDIGKSQYSWIWVSLFLLGYVQAGNKKIKKRRKNDALKNLINPKLKTI